MKYLVLSTVLSTLLQQTAADAAAATVLAPAGGPDTPIDVIARNYTDAEGTLLQGYLSLPNTNNGDNQDEQTVTRPAVIVLHDQSGPDTYEQQRATILAQHLGHVGFAADIFGVNTIQPPADAPWSERSQFVSQFTGNATLFSMRIQAAVEYVQGLEEVDETKVAIVGYCLGGTGVVHYLNTRDDSLDGVPLAGAVGIHPSLLQWPGPTVEIKIPALFLTGGNDFLTSPQTMAKLETDMTMGTATDDAESIKAPWETVRYAKINHAFSNWFSGDSYDERADARSWHSMTTFLNKEFGLSDYESEPPPPGPDANVVSVTYTDGMVDDSPNFLVNRSRLMGYVAMPESSSEGTLLPAVIILPHKMDSAGPDQYEQQRATELANTTGYIGFVADIYSAELTEFTADELEEMYHANRTKYISRIQAAVDHVKTMEGVDPDKIAVIGFGFGGSGALYYALSEEGVDGSVKAIASFHGELEDVAKVAEAKMATEDTVSTGDGDAFTWGGPASATEEGDTWSSGTTDNGAQTDAASTGDGNNTQWGSVPAEGGNDRTAGSFNRMNGGRRVNTAGTTPQILIQSGVEEDDMDDIILIEKALIDMEADYELTRFSDTEESFTLWNDEDYNPRATVRSMDQLNTVLSEVFAAPLAATLDDGDDGTTSIGNNATEDHLEGEHGHDDSTENIESSALFLATNIGLVFATTVTMVLLQV